MAILALKVFLREDENFLKAKVLPPTVAVLT